MRDEDKDRRIAQLEAEVARLREASALRELPAELSKREALLVEAERVAHMGSWVWNLRTGEIGWSDEFYRILGFDPKQVEPSAPGFFAAVHPDDLVRVQKLTERSLEAGEPEAIELRLRRPNGEIRDVRMEAALVYDACGERAHLVGTVLDVTEQLRNAALLKRTVAELNEAQRAAGLGSWRWQGMHTLEWSAGMYYLFGLNGDEPPSEDLFMHHVHPEDREHVARARHEAVASKIGVPLEMRIVRSDGSVRDVVMQSRAMYEDSEWNGFSGVIQDITERKMLELQLRQSQKMEAVGTLAGGVAHDFNNYLMVIGGHTELLSVTLPSAQPGLASVAAISDAYQRCAALTKQLLTLSRRRHAELEPVDLPKLIKDVTPLLDSVLGETIQLYLDVDEPAVIEADPTQVEQVIMNLAVNARDAMPKGGALTLSVADVLVEPGFVASRGAGASEHFVRFSVRDDGQGMTEEVRARIFEPFFTTKGVGRGTGLGLATVYGILSAAGGAIEVESAPGQGSTFHTYWRPSRGPAPATESGEPSVAVLGRGGTVILVEDVDQLRDLLRHQLEQAGYNVLTAGDGLQALQRMAEADVDVVVSDVVMPRMGGVELVRRLHQQYPSVRCLLMTGYSADALQGLNEPGMPTGVCERLMRKPFTSRQLVQAVGELLAESRMA